MLLEHGAEINSKITVSIWAFLTVFLPTLASKDGSTALHLSAMNNHTEVITVLLRHGVDISITDNVRVLFNVNSPQGWQHGRCQSARQWTFCGGTDTWWIGGRASSGADSQGPTSPTVVVEGEDESALGRKPSMGKQSFGWLRKASAVGCLISLSLYLIQPLFSSRHTLSYFYSMLFYPSFIRYYLYFFSTPTYLANSVSLCPFILTRCSRSNPNEKNP